MCPDTKAKIRVLIQSLASNHEAAAIEMKPAASGANLYTHEFTYCSLELEMCCSARVSVAAWQPRRPSAGRHTTPNSRCCEHQPGRDSRCSRRGPAAERYGSGPEHSGRPTRGQADEAYSRHRPELSFCICQH